MARQIKPKRTRLEEIRLAKKITLWELVSVCHASTGTICKVLKGTAFKNEENDLIKQRLLRYLKINNKILECSYAEYRKWFRRTFKKEINKLIFKTKLSDYCLSRKLRIKMPKYIIKPVKITFWNLPEQPVKKMYRLFYGKGKQKDFKDYADAKEWYEQNLGCNTKYEPKSFCINIHQRKTKIY